MAKHAVVVSGGKQYLVKEGDEITVDHITADEKSQVKLDALATLDSSSGQVELGAPSLTQKVNATVIEQGKGPKIRVARFKAKVRYRKTKGFRAHLTKLKIGKI